MNKLLKVSMSMLLVVATLCFIGCNKADDPNNGGNGNNNGNNGETPEAPTIISTSEVQYDGTVFIEAVFEDETKMYFEILSPYEVALVSGEFYYQDNPSLAYMYRGEVVIPESIKHLGTTYSVVSIAKKAFYHNEMVTSVYIPNTVTAINSYYTDSYYPNEHALGVFQDCSCLERIHMSDNIQIIDGNAFYGCLCYADTVTVLSHVKQIGACAYDSRTVRFNADSCLVAGGSYGTPANPTVATSFPQMNSISFGTNVKVLPSYIYSGGLFTGSFPHDVEIPASIQIINDHALSTIFQINSTITCRAINPPVLGKDVFGQRVIEVIYVQMSSVDAYKIADGWSKYADVIVGI